jgi:LytS/YehU family sensor histidine kinase
LLRAAITPLQDGEQEQGVAVLTELELLTRYLALQQLRLDARLRVEWQRDPQVDLAVVPRLTLVTLAENAVRHAIDRHPDGGRIVVSTAQHGDIAVLAIDDTGAARSTRALDTHGLGLRLIGERLRLLHGPRASLTLCPNTLGGTRAEVRIPLDTRVE